MTITGALLIILCIAIAWFLGYRSSKNPPSLSSKKFNIPRDYLKGLNFLLNEETDKAVEVFVKMLEVDSETVETHLAVGKLFRKRGEVDRALRIHQNLIARPHLEPFIRDQAMFELGQDYLSAGMIDRAERIFQELIKSETMADHALQALIDIYEQAKDWQNAIKAAIQLEACGEHQLNANIAQYYCELAELAIQKKSNAEVFNYLEKALKADKACSRASLLQGKLFMQHDDYKNAARSFKRVKDQNPAFLSEAIEPLAQCYEKTHDEERFVFYLKQLLDEFPHVPAVLILAERICERKGEKVAINFVADYVRRYPTLRGLSILINLYISKVEGRTKQDLEIVQNMMIKILSGKPEYQCHSCGFSGNTLHWQCPGCKSWGAIVPMHGVDKFAVV